MKDGDDGGGGAASNFAGERADRGEVGGAGFQRGPVKELDIQRGRVFDGVFGGEGADGFGDGEKELVGLF